MDSDWKGDLFTKSLDNRERFIGGSIIAYDHLMYRHSLLFDGFQLLRKEFSTIVRT